MRSPYKQGFFAPRFPKKYTGKPPIVYRSGLELKFMRWIDENTNVVNWGSESIVVPYQSPVDGKIHRYFVDLNIDLKESQTGKIIKYLVEIKPAKQLLRPDPKRKNKRSLLYEQLEYAKNMSKWHAAKAWCESNGRKFLILTEKNLPNLSP